MTLAISIDAASFARAAGILEREPERVERELRALVQHSALRAKEALARATPVSHPEGDEPEHAPHMRETWEEESTGPLESAVWSSAPYAPFLFQPTAPHVIRPVRARVLRFWAGGSLIFAGAVQHPGTLPNPRLLAALDDQIKKAEGDLFDFGVAEVARLAHAL